MMGLMLIHLAFAACDFPISSQMLQVAGGKPFAVGRYYGADGAK